MLLKKSMLKLVPIALIGAAGVSPAIGANAQSLDAVGPLEQLNCQARTLRLLGISFRANDTSILTAICDPSNQTTFKYVAVTATRGMDGLLTASRISLVLGDEYVPGTTSVYVRGSVTSQKLRIGEFGLSGSSVLGFPSTAPNVGDLIEVVGTQPVLGGPILATTLRGIVGSGVASNGIVGSGVTTNGIVGSGVALSGIVGSGVASNGIVGSGVATSGIVGSGKSLSGIVGSGIALNGIVGSGVAVNGIVGSGVSAQGIVGSGVATHGIVGSGVAVRGIVGSGVAKNGIVGSG